MINIENAWQLVSNSAKKAIATEMVYCSMIEKKLYKVKSVEETKITIERKSGGHDGELTKAKVERAIAKFNSNGGKPMKRRTLIEKSVVEETALVLFHPNLAWDETGDYIIEV